MNLKSLVCLALVSSCGLSGCATAAPHHCRIQSPNVAAMAGVELKFVSADSEETEGQDGHGRNAVDGDPNTYWHTQWNGASPGLPHEIILELLPPSIIKGFTYLPRQDESDHGTIKDFEFYVSDDGRNFGQPVKQGTFDPGKAEKIETFAPIKCRFIKLRAVTEINGLPWTSAAEIRVIQTGESASPTESGRGGLGLIPRRPNPHHPDAMDIPFNEFEPLGPGRRLPSDPTRPKFISGPANGRAWAIAVGVVRLNGSRAS